MTLKVLIAPQEFKGTLTAAQAAEAIRRGFASVHDQAQIDVVPIADGGAGTVDVMLNANGRGTDHHRHRRAWPACEGALGFARRR
jgi:glycerate 2-kinase